MANFTNHRDSQVVLRWDRFRATDHSALLTPMTRKDADRRLSLPLPPIVLGSSNSSVVNCCKQANYIDLL